MNVNFIKLLIIHLTKTDDFMKGYKKCEIEPYSFMFNDTALPSGHPLPLRKI